MTGTQLEVSFGPDCDSGRLPAKSRQPHQLGSHDMCVDLDRFGRHVRAATQCLEQSLVRPVKV
jgi:hypothetical protein